MLKSMPRGVTPILVALEPGTPFEQLVAPDAAVPFDLDGSGFKRKWGWITPKAAWLVYVPRAAGRSPRGSRCSATSLFWDFLAQRLRRPRRPGRQRDGRLTGPELRGLCLWTTGNGNGISEPGEVVPVESLGNHRHPMRLHTKRHWNALEPGRSRFSRTAAPAPPTTGPRQAVVARLAGSSAAGAGTSRPRSSRRQDRPDERGRSFVLREPRNRMWGRDVPTPPEGGRPHRSVSYQGIFWTTT